MNLEALSWVALWSPWLFVSLLIVGMVYGSWRRMVHERVWSRQAVSFFLGLACLYIGLGSPIDVYGHIMFTFHMITMTLAFLIAPVLLLSGLDDRMLHLIAHWRVWRFFRSCVHPIFALVSFNIAFSVYHIPFVHDAVMYHYTLHTAYYIVLFVTGVLMWIPIVAPYRALDVLEGYKKMGYIFANSVLLLPACALIIFASAPFYATYTDASLWAVAMGYCVPQMTPAQVLQLFGGPEQLSWFDPLRDQQLGGVIMKLAQEVVYGSILVFVFRQWYRRENEHDEDGLNPIPSS
jgi:putative membrane protein